MLHKKERKSPSTCLLPLYFLQMVSTIYNLKIHTVNYPRPTGIVPHCSKSIPNKPKPNTKQNFKFFGNRVVAVLECVQCKKPRCIFSRTVSTYPFKLAKSGGHHCYLWDVFRFQISIYSHKS